MYIVLTTVFLFSAVFTSASTPLINDSFDDNKTGVRPTGLALEFAADIDFNYYGLLSPERQQMIDQLVHSRLSYAIKRETPKLTIMLGAPGSGKSRVIEHLWDIGFFKNSGSAVISADDFKENIPEYIKLLKIAPGIAAPYVHRESLYAFDLATLKAIKEGQSVILDGANSHLKTMLQFIRLARQSGHGYKIELIRVQTTVETALKRAERRFKQQGRSVPENEIIEKSELIRDVFAELAPQVDTYVTVANESEIVIKQIVTPKTSANRPIDIVIDIDWTLVYELQKQPTNLQDPNVFEFGGKYYRYSDYAREFISTLRRLDPRYRLSFYSGGERDRVEFTLKNLVIDGDTTAFEIAFQVLNKASLETVDEGAERFSDRYKKNLRRIIRSIDFSRAVLIDDIADFLFAGQERCMLWLGKTYNFFANRAELDEARKTDPTNKYLPAEKGRDGGDLSYRLERNKLPYALGVIIEATKIHDTTGLEFNDAMNSLTRDAQGNFIDRELPQQRRFYQRGLKAMEALLKQLANSKNTSDFSKPPSPFNSGRKSKASSGSMCIDLFAG